VSKESRPEHHGRPMLRVEDSNSESPFYGLPIWWCADCHLKIPVRKGEQKTRARPAEYGGSNPT